MEMGRVEFEERNEARYKLTDYLLLSRYQISSTFLPRNTIHQKIREHLQDLNNKY